MPATRPKKGEEKGHLLKRVSFNIYENDLFEIDVAEGRKLKKIKMTGQELVEVLLRLKTHDPYVSESEIVKALTAEAGHHHDPGNPGVALEHWFPDNPLPFSEAAREKGFRNLPPDTRIVPCPDCRGQGCRGCAGKGSISEIRAP